MVTIATWNVNSVKARLEHLVGYLRSQQAPDILLLQEIKCMEEAFPFMEVEDTGYNVVASGQKTYNGIAILSKYPLDDVVKVLPGDGEDTQARYIEAVVSINSGAVRVASVYVPNGKSPDSENFTYKKRFLDRLKDHARTLLTYQEPLVIGGDYNISPEPALDIYDPKGLEGTICCHKDERQKFRSLIGLGLTDAYRALHPDSQQFSWWDYRGGSWQHNKGLRIDHLLLSPEATDQLTKCDVDTRLRSLEKPSDHTPVWCQLTL